MEESDSNEQKSQPQEDDEHPVQDPVVPPASLASAMTTNTTDSFILPPKSLVESNLMGALVEMQVRSEVEACMNSLLIDVEMTHYLRQELKVKACQERVEYLELQQEATVMESKALQLQREENRLELADQLVKDLWSLSRELESLTQWKQAHEDKVLKYDDLVAKLAQSEEELAAANRITYGGGVPPRLPEPTRGQESHVPGGSVESTDVVDDAKPSVVGIGSPSEEKQIIVDQANAEPDPEPVVDEVETEDQKPPAEPSKEAKEDLHQEGEVFSMPSSSSLPDADSPMEGESETALEAVASEIKNDEEQNNLAENADKGEAPAAAAVTLDEEEAEKEVPGLVDIDIEILMNIFGFMDPIDILNTAQVNLAMYSRVDNLFGLAEDGHGPPKPPERTPTPAPAVARAPSIPAATASQAVPPSTTSKQTQSTIVKANPTTAEAAATGAMSLFSMLQPRAAGSTVASAATTASKQRQQDSPSKSGSQPLNAAVAQSMAAKLSAAELAAIISMTEKLSKMEQEINNLRNEKEELQGKLEGTEAVKQFLIGKVRDVERNLRQFKENEVKVTQQISSDQEVIGFLDARVQVLERETTSLTKEKTQAETDLRNLKGSTGQKITVLSDMLKFEREKLRESESEWKSTKKVLVKEVKSCRAQILALQAERDGYREQNDMLKRAIVNKGKNGGGSPPRR